MFHFSVVSTVVSFFDMLLFFTASGRASERSCVEVCLENIGEVFTVRREEGGKREGFFFFFFGARCSFFEDSRHVFDSSSILPGPD